MDTRVAGMYAVILIIISCSISLIFNIICGIMVIIIELLIASTIIKIEYM